MRSRAAFSCNETTGRLVELIKTRRLYYGTFSEASPAGFYSRSPAAHHWSPHRCGVPPNLTESSSQGRVQTTPSVNKWSAATRHQDDQLWCEEHVVRHVPGLDHRVGAVRHEACAEGSRTGRALCAMPLPIGMCIAVCTLCGLRVRT